MPSFTITPQFDTDRLDVPSDIEVYYSADQVTWVASNTVNHGFTVSVPSTTTYYAQFRYDASTPVLDTNGDQLPILSAVLPVSFERNYSKNLGIVAEMIKSQKASILVVGDSINNPTQADYMREGYVEEWKPDYWRGLSPGMSGGNANDNGWIMAGAGGANITGFSTNNGPDPNNSSYTTPLFSGLAVTGGGSDWNELTDTVGGNTTDNAAAFELARATPSAANIDRFVGSAQSVAYWREPDMTYRSLWYSPTAGTIQGQYRGATAADSVNVDHTLRQGYVVLEQLVGNSANGSNSQFTSWTSKLPVGSKTQMLAFYALSPSTQGLTMAYTGGGGWGTANHRYSDDRAPTVPGSGGRSCWYDDAAAKAYMDLMETDIVMIHLGANDGLLTEFTDHIEAVINRYRKLRPGVKFLLVSQYAATSNQTRWSDQSDFCRALAGSTGNLDVAFLDLYRMTYDNIGLYADIADTYLDDVVHPNIDGSRLFAQLEWTEIAAVAGGAGAQPGVYAIGAPAPGDVVIGDLVTVSAVSSGVGSVNTSYVWKVNGVVQGGQVLSFFNTNSLSDGQTLTCEVTVSDDNGSVLKVVDFGAVTASETILDTWNKNEDSATALSVNASGWYLSNTAYTANITSGFTYTNQANYPRLRRTFEGATTAIVVDLSFNSQANRDAFITAHPNARVRATFFDSEGLSESVTTDTITNLISRFTGNLDPDPTNNLLRMPLEGSDFSAVPDSNTGGNGSNLGMDENMAVFLELIE